MQISIVWESCWEASSQLKERKMKDETRMFGMQREPKLMNISQWDFPKIQCWIQMSEWVQIRLLISMILPHPVSLLNRPPPLSCLLDVIFLLFLPSLLLHDWFIQWHASYLGLTSFMVDNALCLFWTIWKGITCWGKKVHSQNTKTFSWHLLCGVVREQSRGKLTWV